MKWIKPYRGPFTRGEACVIAQQLKDVASPEVNLIHDAKIRKRPNKDLFDVLVFVEK